MRLEGQAGWNHNLRSPGKKLDYLGHWEVCEGFLCMFRLTSDYASGHVTVNKHYIYIIYILYICI